MASEHDYESVTKIQNLGGVCPYCGSMSGHYYPCILLGQHYAAKPKPSILDPASASVWDWPVSVSLTEADITLLKEMRIKI